MTSLPIVITVDGPSGAGKGTLCKKLAAAFDFHLLDSGSLYRLTALAAARKGVDWQDVSSVTSIAANLEVQFKIIGSSLLIELNNEDVTQAIREEHIGMGASVVAAIESVRSALLERQRQFAQLPGLVADGRDMGTVVFPQAQLKVFLTASAEERAKRRVLQIEEKGGAADYKDVLADIQARDERDSSRSAAPLKAAIDAIVIDSTQLGIESVFETVLSVAKERNIA